MSSQTSLSSDINALIARRQFEVNELLDHAKAVKRELEEYQTTVLPNKQKALVELREIVEEDRKKLNAEEQKKKEAIMKLKDAEIALENETKRKETAQNDSNYWQNRYGEALDKFWKS